MNQQHSMFDSVPEVATFEKQPEQARDYEAELDAWVAEADPDSESWTYKNRQSHRDARRRTLQFYDKMRRVAELLGYDFFLEEDGGLCYDPSRVELREPGSTVRGYSARIHWQNQKMVHFSGMTQDLGDHVYYDERDDAINVNRERPAEEMAREIYGRLRQPYREIRARGESRKDAFESELIQLRQMVEQAKAVASPNARGEVTVRGRGDRQANFDAGTWPGPCMKGEASLYDGPHYDLKFERLPPALALRLLQEYGEYITNKD